MIYKLKQFSDSLPSLRILEKYADKIDVNDPAKIKEVYSIYIVIELLNLYYKRFDYPLFNVKNIL